MTQIYDEFYRLVSSRKNYRARSFININCPACGDRRKRGGFAPTSTGGFRYFCFNGGCEFHDHPTGWEPGNGLTGRARKLFDLLGGDIRDIPVSELVVHTRPMFDSKGNLIGHTENLEVVRSFPDCDVPMDTGLLVDWADKNADAKEVLRYLNKRGSFFINEHPFLWTPIHPRHLIIPFVHYNHQIVGYVGRNIDSNSADDRFIQRSPADYLFNQHKLTENRYPHVFVIEAPLDAIALRGVATRGSKFTQKQINLLKMSGKTPILIPDRRGREWRNYLDVAMEQNWPICIPDWEVGVKDPGEAVQKNGLLYTIEELYAIQTTNYDLAKIKLNTGG